MIAARSDKVWRVGTKKVYRVQLASGRTMRATAEHRLLAGNGWSTVVATSGWRRIGIGASSCRSRQQSQRWPEHWLILLGHLVGDGSYLKTSAAAIHVWLRNGI